MQKALTMIDQERVYQLLREIPKGKVTTYKIIADKLGNKAYRAIGKITSLNPDIPATPCHRVVKSDGSISGYAHGINKKIALLLQEGVVVKSDKIVNFKQKLYNFKG